MPADNVLTVRLTGKDDDLSLPAFLNVMRDSLNILRDIDAHLSATGRNTLKWTITDVHMSSPLSITVTGVPIKADQYNGKVVALYLDDLDKLERGQQPSQHFSERCLEKAKRLSAQLNNGVSSVVFSGPPAKPVTPTQHLAANVDALLKKRYRYESTAMEGRLEALNVHGALTFHIYDVLTDAKTVCVFKEELYAGAYAALRHRVAVTGRAKYNRAGQAVSIEVESLRQLRTSPELPKFRDGEAIDITGGMDSAEYVRRIRDAE